MCLNSQWLQKVEARTVPHLLSDDAAKIARTYCFPRDRGFKAPLVNQSAGIASFNY
jgi:hypothetical protein